LRDPDLDIPEFSYRARRQTPAFDPLMRRIALGAGAVATLIILVALVWSGMKPGMGFGPPPVIQAPPGPLRVVPTDPGGLTVPEADEQIMSGDSSNAPPQLAPAPAAPDISQFQNSQTAPVSPASVSSAPSSVAPATATPAAAPTPPALVTPPTPIDGKIQVQLAASVDPGGARTTWKRLNAKMPDLMAGHSPIYSRATVAGVEFWRLRVNGFTGITDARQFCAAVKAQGGACTVAAF
jgi:hypothetical protein